MRKPVSGGHEAHQESEHSLSDSSLPPPVASSTRLFHLLDGADDFRDAPETVTGEVACDRRAPLANHIQVAARDDVQEFSRHLHADIAREDLFEDVDAHVPDLVFGLIQHVDRLRADLEYHIGIAGRTRFDDRLVALAKEGAIDSAADHDADFDALFDRAHRLTGGLPGFKK